MVRSAYVKHDRVYAPVEGVSRTRQEFKDECDINSIMKKYRASGILQHVNRAQPRYMDFTEVPNFHEAMNFMVEADRNFMMLSADVRKRFGNDPAEFVKFAEDKDNLEELRGWGLAKPKEEPPAPQRVEVVNPASAPVAAPNEPVKGSK